MRNSGNYNYDYATSLIGKDFYSKPLYWFMNGEVYGYSGNMICTFDGLVQRIQRSTEFMRFNITADATMEN